MDHSPPTTPRGTIPLAPVDAQAAAQLRQLEHSCRDFGIPLSALGHASRGIVHVIGPEQGFTQPGLTIVIRRPADFDVIRTENMFGDIRTEEAAVLTGSLGMLPSASLGPPARPDRGTRTGPYEPIHGAAPDIAGQGIADPGGMIRSGALLRHMLGREAAARAVEAAVSAVRDAGLASAGIAAPGAPAATTKEVDQAVAAQIAAAAPSPEPPPPAAPDGTDCPRGHASNRRSCQG